MSQSTPSPCCAPIGPINPLSDAVLDAIAGGELLPHLLNAGAPDSIDLRALNSAPPDDSTGDSLQPLAKAELPAGSATVPTEPFVARSVAASPPGGVFASGELGAASPLPSSLSPELALENHTLLVNAAASVGSAVPQIHETQLLYAPQHKQVALHQAYNIIKHGLLSKINAQALPHLAALLEDGEKPGQVPPEALLARWINKNVDDYLQQHPQDRRRLPTDHIVNDALVGDITAQLAMALHQVAKEPLFSIGSTILPTVPIVEAIGSAPPQSGAWGQHGAMDPVALESAAAPTQPVAPQPAGVAPPSSWPVESSQAAHERLPTSAGGAGGMAVPRGIGPGLIHLTNDPSLAHSSANMPTVSSVPAVAPGPVAAGDASSSGWARDPLASTLERGLPTTAVVPQLAAGAAGDAPAGGEGHGSSALAMPLQQAIVPTTVQMPLAAAHAGEGLPETFWRASPGARAKQVIDHAVAAGGAKIFAVAPSDLTEPRPRMQQCFVASVVDALGAGGGEEGELDTYEEETNDSAEARVFKNWAASLGLKLNMKDLYADSCSGIVLLKVMDRLEPGAVDWGRVEGTPKNKYETVANCNYAVKVAKELGLKLTGISGQDISEGKEKLMLAVWWQLMRKDFMQFLDDLDMDQAFVLSWANAQVARSGADMQLSRFGDPAIKSGVFLLQLMRAVAPKAIKEDLIRPGHSELDRQLNAKLAISTAHKMGARVFCGWQDILEARPKLMLSMVAAIMSVYLKTNDLTKDDVLREVRRGSVALDSMRASQRGSSESLGERTASTLAGKLAQAWARPHVAPRARLNEAEASKVLAWSKPHAIIESVRRNLEEDRLEDPGKSKAAQIRERASATPRAERGTVKRSEMSKSFATKVKRAKALAVTSRPFAPGLDPMPSARVAIAVDIPPAVGLPAGEPPLPTARGGAPLQPAEKPPVQDAFVVSLEI